jgi:predicted ATPase
MPPLDRITVRGYKSIRALEKFELRPMNLLIGANGAGKSNFISIFRLLTELTEGRLQLFVQEQDGPDALLFGSRKRTKQIEAEFYFAKNGYRVSLRPAGKQLIFSREETWFSGDYIDKARPLGSGQAESRLIEETGDTFTPYVLPAIRSWRIYHFHDTSASSPIRQAQAVRDNLRLKADAGNLAAFLRFLKEKHLSHYHRIVDTIQEVAPFFGDFVHRSDPGEYIELEWFEADDPDTVRGPRQLSDGTLRFICLATLLLQPRKPATILIDEPELGLHPSALAVLAALFRQASETQQLIVSTQSVELVNLFNTGDVVVVSRKDGASVLERLDETRLQDWLADYALGDLWRMNVIGGRPSR